jgi:hypothetical protein
MCFLFRLCSSFIQVGIYGTTLLAYQLVFNFCLNNMWDISWSAGWSSSSLAMTTALAGLLGGYYWVWTRSRFVRLIDALPGPKPLPMLGNILHFANFSLDGI